MRRPLIHRLRQGLTLVEIMVVIAIMGVALAVGGVSMQQLFDLQQQSAVKELAQTYTWLIDEAALRNCSFRIAYNLDQGTWKVEVGDPNTLVFATPEEREEYEEEVADQMTKFTQREIEEGAADELESEQGRFEGLSDPSFNTDQKLPGGTRFAYVYTPQYGRDGVEPNDEMPDDPEEQAIAYTYVFSDGSAEHIVVRVVDEDDPEDGYTLEVEPLSGRVHLSTDLIDPEESMAWLPEEGPEF